MHRLRYLWMILALLLPVTLLAQELPPLNPTSVSGDIAVGTTPVLLVPTQNLSVRFAIDGFTGNVAVTEYVTADGIQRFCNGELDMVLADRQISPQEVNACIANGRNPAAFRIGTKSITIAVSPLNQFVDTLTTAELQEIFSGTPNWSDIRGNWPAEIIGRYGPGITSAEVDYFAQAVFGGNTSQLTLALGSQFNDDPAVALGAVESSQSSIGIFDSGYLLLNEGLVRPVTIDNVEPRFDTISNGSYPLARPLYLYSSASIMQAKPQVAEFIKYYLMNLDLELPAVNLFPPDVPTQQIAVNTWLTAMGQAVVQPEIPAPASTEEVNLAQAPVPTEAVPVVSQPVSPFATDVVPILIAARTDLEVMATQVQGMQRPPGWSGSLDINDPQLALLIRLDLELLAAIVYGETSRPADWFGAVGSTQLAIARDIRHDLEVMADNVYSGTRPQEWAGGNPLYRCNRATQALVAVLARAGLYTVLSDPAAPNYCQLVEIEVARFSEVNLVGDSPITLSQTGEAVDIHAGAEITTEFAVAFLTRNATPSAGVMPLGTPLTPVARSYTPGSNMTLIEGEGYLVFIEFTNTDLTAEEWERLPDIDAIEAYEPFCDAIWCR